MKTKIKFLALIMASLLALTAMVGCSGDTEKEELPDETVTTEVNDAEPETGADMRVFAMNGPTGMGMAKLMNDSKDNKTANNYKFTLVSSAENMKAEIIKGEYEIAAVPTNLAAVLANKTEGGLKIAAVNTLGVLYILENGNSIKSVKDLEGKTIAATGQGSVPEYVLSYILKANNVNANVQFYTDGQEAAQRMLTGDVNIAMLPVPYATNVLGKSDKIRVAVDITEEWAATGNDAGALCQSCIIVRSDFAEKNPDAVNKFLEEYGASVNYINANVDVGATMIVASGIVGSVDVAKAAIPSANMVCITGDKMVDNLTGFFGILFESNPASLGGSAPTNEIYYINE